MCLRQRKGTNGNSEGDVTSFAPHLPRENGDGSWWDFHKRSIGRGQQLPGDEVDNLANLEASWFGMASWFFEPFKDPSLEAAFNTRAFRSYYEVHQVSPQASTSGYSIQLKQQLPPLTTQFRVPRDTVH